MEQNPPQPLLAAQQAAISEARARYERGDLAFEDFRRALDALVLARDAGECRVILDALPSSPLAALNPLNPLNPLEQRAQAAATLAPRRIVAFMGQTKKGRRPWQFAPETEAIAVMGEVRLDLRSAALPARARLQVTAVMGTVVVLVPRNVRVTAHAALLLSGAQTLGERTSGVVGSSHEQHTPVGEPAVAELEIDVLALMSNVRIIVVDESTGLSVNALVRDALRAVAEGVRSGLRQARDQRALPGAYGE